MCVVADLQEGKLYSMFQGNVNTVARGYCRMRLIDEAALALVADGEDERYIVRGIIGV